jgi:uncharacterized coiled-coil protein SlyX
MPELVFQNPTDGYYGLLYGETSGLLIQAIKELNIKVDDLGNVPNLTARIDALETTTTSHTNLIDDLVAAVSSLFTRQQAVETQTDLLTATMADLNIKVSTMSAGINTDNRLTTLESQVATLSTSINDQTISLSNDQTSLATLSARVGYLETRVTGQVAPEPLPVATIAGVIDMITPVETRITDLESKMDLALDLTASQSALISYLLSPISTDSATPAQDLNLDVESVFVSDFLSVLGDTILTDLTVTNNFTVSSINSLDGNLDLISGLVTLDGAGSLVTINGDLVVTGNLSAPIIDAMSLQLASLSAQINELSISQSNDQTLIASLSAQVASLSAEISSPSASPAVVSDEGEATIAESEPEPTTTTSTRLTTLSQIQ